MESGNCSSTAPSVPATPPKLALSIPEAISGRLVFGEIYVGQICGIRFFRAIESRRCSSASRRDRVVIRSRGDATARIEMEGVHAIQDFLLGFADHQFFSGEQGDNGIRGLLD